MEEAKLVKTVYIMSRYQYVNHRTKNWCATIHRLVIKYGLLDLWKTEDLVRNPNVENLRTIEQIRNYWYKFIKARIQQVEERIGLKG